MQLKRTLSAVEVRRKLGEVLEGVYYRGDEVVIERAGKPMAVVVPTERYEIMERSRDRLFDFIERNWAKNTDVPSQELEDAITKAIREVRSRSSKQVRHPMNESRSRH
jgi:prevent-host-death family protein